NGFRGEYELEFRDGYPPLINSKEVTEEFIISAKKIVDECDINIMENSLMGGEDAAFFFEKIPGSYFFLNTPSEHNGVLYPAHNSKFKIDETYLYLGSALFTQVVMDLIG
ncbi:MAG: M20/M25/M40 family metallo-hydrolase, partial [Erysipelotrichaceae bacterium]